MSQVFVIRLTNTQWLSRTEKPVQMNTGLGKLAKYKSMHWARKALSSVSSKGLIGDEHLAGIYRIDTTKPYIYPEKITNHLGERIGLASKRF